jgi:hypothetical protein
MFEFLFEDKKIPRVFQEEKAIFKVFNFKHF